MNKKIFFWAIVIFLFTSSQSFAIDNPDTCEVISVYNILPYSHLEVGVKVLTDQELAGVDIPLAWGDSNTVDIICDSISWSDWFWDNPAASYSGKEGDLFEDYINNDTIPHQLKIQAIWWLGPYLPPDTNLLATIHFSIGEMNLIQPNGGEEWYSGAGQLIKWSSQCDWNVNDTVVIDSFRRTDNYPTLPVNFSDPLGGEPSVEFNNGYLVRSTQTSDSVKIEYSIDAGKIWSTIVAGTPNDGEFLWSSIPDTASDSCLIKITSKAENPISVLSADFFTIIAETSEVREEKKPNNLPERFVLYQNYPNPFNPSTKIEFSLSERAQVKLEIYDIAGRRVKRLVDEELPSGHWSIVWEGEDDKRAKVASGVYFYRLIASQYTQTRKMVIIK